jgi:glycerol-3-phosphate cytidylyltransferase
MKKGVIAGAFDIMHPGYIKMFKEAKEECDCLIVLLHTDPSIERPYKMRPLLSPRDRKEMLESIKYVDDVIRYTYEEQLYHLLREGEFDIRFLGSDYINEPFTGDDLKIEIHYLNRSHGWSTTKFKGMIADQYDKDWHKKNKLPK